MDAGGTDIYDAPERILSIRFPQFRLESSLTQRIDHGPQRRQIGADAEVEIIGLAHVMMGRKRHCPNYDGDDVMSS